MQCCLCFFPSTHVSDHISKLSSLLNRFPHDDGTATSHLSAYSPSSSTTYTHNSHYTLPKAYLSVGAESGVVSLFGADRDAQSGAYDFFNGTIDANRTVRSAPKQLKSLLNLTTQITSSVFHPSGQIAAIASNQVCFLSLLPISHAFGVYLSELSLVEPFFLRLWFA